MDSMTTNTHTPRFQVGSILAGNNQSATANLYKVLEVHDSHIIIYRLHDKDNDPEAVFYSDMIRDTLSLASDELLNYHWNSLQRRREELAKQDTVLRMVQDAIRPEGTIKQQ